MNVQHSLIREHKPYEFEQDHNAADATKNISSEEDKGVVDYSTVTRWFKKFRSECKYFDDQAKSCKSKTQAVIQALTVSNTRRYQPTTGFHNPVLLVTYVTSSKAFKDNWLLLLVTKIFQNFWFTLV